MAFAVDDGRDLTGDDLLGASRTRCLSNSDQFCFSSVNMDDTVSLRVYNVGNPFYPISEKIGRCLKAGQKTIVSETEDVMVMPEDASAHFAGLVRIVAY